MTEFKVGDLTKFAKKVDIKVHINSQISTERTVFNRKKNVEQKVAEFEVGDPTGTIILTAWDDEILKIKDLIGSSIEISNGYVSEFKGQLKLSAGIYGSWKPIDEDIESIQGSRVLPQQAPVPESGVFHVSDLNSSSSGVNIKLKIKRKDEPRDVNVRGTPHHVTSALVGDETGCILLSLWDEDIPKFNVDDYIELKGGYVSVFRDVMQLNKGRSGGEFTKIEGNFEVDEKNNLSMKEL